MNLFCFAKSTNISLSLETLEKKQLRLENMNCFTIPSNAASLSESFDITQNLRPEFNKLNDHQLVKESLTECEMIIEWWLSPKSFVVCALYTRDSNPQVFHLIEKEETFLISHLLKELEQNQMVHNWTNEFACQLSNSLKLSELVKFIIKNESRVQKIELVPHMDLHLCPIHALPIDNTKCLLDYFPRGVVSKKRFTLYN